MATQAPVSLAEWIDALLDAEPEDLNLVTIAALRSSLALQEIVCVRHGFVARWTGMARHLRETELEYRAAHAEDGEHAGLHRRGDLRPRTPADRPAPAPWEVSQCRSCGAAVIWAVTARDARMPLDAAPAAVGDLLLVAAADAGAAPRVIRLHTEAERAQLGPDVELRVSHFATCPHAAVHRRRPR